jgi:hypothetical protein
MTDIVADLAVLDIVLEDMQDYCDQCKLGGYMRGICPASCTVAQCTYRTLQAWDDTVTKWKRVSVT